MRIVGIRRYRIQDRIAANGTHLSVEAAQAQKTLEEAVTPPIAAVTAIKVVVAMPVPIYNGLPIPKTPYESGRDFAQMLGI